MEPKKEPKKAAFVAVNAAGYTQTGFNAIHRSRAGSFAADLCAKRTGKSLKISDKTSELVFR